MTAPGRGRRRNHLLATRVYARIAAEAEAKSRRRRRPKAVPITPTPDEAPEPAPELEQFQNLPQPPPVRSIGDPWGNLARLPPRPLPDYVRKEAEALGEVRMFDRITLVDQLIFNTRVMRGLMGLEDEILELAGFPNGEYWRARVGRQCTPESYAFHLSRFFADPADPGNPGDILPVVPGNSPVDYGNMSIVQRLLRDALRRAYDIGEPFFVLTRKGIAEIITDQAGQWLLADERYREILPQSYRAFLEKGGHAQPLPAPRAEPAPDAAELPDRDEARRRGRPKGKTPKLDPALNALQSLRRSGVNIDPLTIKELGQLLEKGGNLIPYSTLRRAVIEFKK